MSFVCIHFVAAFILIQYVWIGYVVLILLRALVYFIKKNPFMVASNIFLDYSMFH